MVHAVLKNDFDLDARAIAKDRSSSALSRIWKALLEAQQTRANKEIAATLRNYDDNALQSLGYDAEDIARIRSL